MPLESTAVTTVLLSPVSRLPYWILFVNDGLGGERLPGGGRRRRLLDEDHSLLAAAGLTTTGLETAGARLPLVNWSVMVSALLSARFEKVATPPETTAVLSPGAGRRRWRARP